MSKQSHPLKTKKCFTRFIFVQAVYQHSINPTSVDELVMQFQQRYQKSQNKHIDWPLLQVLLRAFMVYQKEVNAAIAQLMHTPRSETNMVNMAIMRCGLLEIMRGDIPIALLIAHYISIALSIGTPKGYALVNGIFDKAAKINLTSSARARIRQCPERILEELL